MVTYEVTSVVDAELVPAYEEYMLNHHIADVLGTGCFVEASFSRVEGNRYRIRYEASDPAAVDRYLSEHAARMRGDFHDHFPAGIQVSRDIWTVLKQWRGPEVAPASPARP